MRVAEEHRAEPPRAPELLPAQQRAELARTEVLRARLGVEERSFLRGLMLLALVVLLVSLARAGFGRLFVPGWWRQW